MKRCLIYALGGGFGHAVRGAGLARALAELGVEARVLCAQEAQPRASALFADVVGLSREAHGSAARLRERVEVELRGRDALILDTFPNGILAELNCLAPAVPRVLLTRFQRAAPRSLQSEAGWAGLGLSGVVDIEPNLEWLPGPALRCGPVARRLTPLSHVSAPDVQVVLSDPGVRGRVAALLERARDVSSEVLELDGLAAGYSARIVIGAAGYNLSYELCLAGIWHVALPFGRPIDDQGLRARRMGTLVQSPEALERRVRALLHAGVRPTSGVLEHRTLAEQLLAYLEERIQAHRWS